MLVSAFLVKILYTWLSGFPSISFTANRSALSSSQLWVDGPHFNAFIYTNALTPCFRASLTALLNTSLPSLGGKYSGNESSYAPPCHQCQSTLTRLSRRLLNAAAGGNTFAAYPPFHTQ